MGEENEYFTQARIRKSNWSLNSHISSKRSHKSTSPSPTLCSVCTNVLHFPVGPYTILMQLYFVLPTIVGRFLGIWEVYVSASKWHLETLHVL